MDHRIAVSEEKLIAAYEKMLLKMEPRDITVVELCREAGVNRTTFYNRYQYMELLEHAVLKKHVEQVCDVDYTVEPVLDEEGAIKRSIIKGYLERFFQDEVLNRFCMCEERRRFLSEIISLQAERTIPVIRDMKTLYVALFQNAGVITILMDWVSKGMPLPEESIVEVIRQFSKAMFQKE